MANSAHIFYNKAVDTEQWGAGGMLVTWGEPNGGALSSVPMVMQGVQFEYQKAEQDVWPVNLDPNGNMKKIIINGMPQGTLTCDSIIGPKSCNLYGFLERAGRPCADTIDMQLQPFATTCQSGGIVPVMYYLKGVVLSGLVTSIQTAQNGMQFVNTRVSFRFTELIISGNDSCNDAARNDAQREEEFAQEQSA